MSGVSHRPSLIWHQDHTYQIVGMGLFGHAMCDVQASGRGQ